MLIFHEAVIDLRIFMDLRQGIIVYPISAVLCNILIEHVDDLLFQLTVLRKNYRGNLNTEPERMQEKTNIFDMNMMQRLAFDQGFTLVIRPLKGSLDYGILKMRRSIVFLAFYLQNGFYLLGGKYEK